MVTILNKLKNTLSLNNNKEYRNADLYNILGKDYPKILEFGYGKMWEYIRLQDNIEHINNRLGTKFSYKEKFEDILYEVKLMYLNKLKNGNESTSGYSNNELYV